MSDAEKLLPAWFHPGTRGEGYIEIAVLPTREIAFSKTPGEAAAKALTNAPGHNVYFGLHPRKAACGSGKLGRAEIGDVLGLAGLAADLDLHGKDIKHASIEDALAALKDRLPPELQPPIIVNSGYGIWALWPFLALLPAACHAAYLAIGKRLAALLDSDRSVYDAPRIARVPGTLNLRDPARPVEARLLLCEEGRYFSLDDFDKVLPLEQKPPTEKPRPRPVVAADPAQEDRILAIARRHVAAIPGAVAGEHGHDRTFQAAQDLVRGYSLSAAVAFDMLWSDFNPRCQPRWSEKELRRKVREAAEKSRLTDGYLLDRDAPADVGGTPYSDDDEQANGPASAGTGQAPPRGFGPLSPLPPDEDAREFDSALVPHALQGWVLDEAERGGFPSSFVAVAAVVTASAVLGRQVRICAKRHDTWSEPALLWGLLSAASGVGKTPALLAGSAFVRSAHEARMKEALDRLQKWEADARATRAARTLVVAERPSFGRQLITNESTVEGLRGPLAESPAGILLLRDELSGWLATMEREGREGERQFFLEAWGGSGSYTVNRKGEGTIFIPRPAVAVLGGAQPGVVAKLAAGPEDGLLPRFSLLVTEERADGEMIDRAPDAKATAQAREAFERVLAFDPAKWSGPKDADGNPLVRFAEDAQERYLDWAREHRAALAGLTGPVCQHLSKYQAAVPRMALTFHMLEAKDVHASCAVGLALLELAIGWTKYLTPIARAVYGRRAQSGARELARRLIAREVGDGFSAYEVGSKDWRSLRGTPTVVDAADQLVALGWLQAREPQPGDKGGRPTTRYWINPAVYTDGEKHMGVPPRKPREPSQAVPRETPEVVFGVSGVGVGSNSREPEDDGAAGDDSPPVLDLGPEDGSGT